jgi:hypothetical protein
LIVLKSMERKDLLMVALEIFPELNARGFFTTEKGVEYYFAGLQEMEIESAYKSFYEEYDVAFNIRCTYSVCDYKTESRWIRMDGQHHLYRTPMLYVVNRIDLNASPAQIAYRMNGHYRANTLVVEKYFHPEFSTSSLKSFLAAHGIYVVIKKHEKVQELLGIKKTASAGDQNNISPLPREAEILEQSFFEK